MKNIFDIMKFISMNCQFVVNKMSYGNLAKNMTFEMFKIKCWCFEDEN